MGAEDEPTPPLSIGIVYDWSPDGRRWQDTLTALARAVVEHRKGVSSPLNVNVTYHVFGRMLKPDYEGVRTGSFHRRDNLLMVQCAVGPGPDDDADAAARRLLEEAVEEAEHWAEARRIADALPTLRDLAARV